MPVRMNLSKVIINEMHALQIIVLQEVGGERRFPIVIGTPEAQAINRRLDGQPGPRPMTHDLLASVISALGGNLERIDITDLLDQAFIATLSIRQGEQLLTIDSRPSDAIALGVASDTPVYVAEHVLDQVQ
jgi:bifunctional DNase/RNase